MRRFLGRCSYSRCWEEDIPVSCLVIAKRFRLSYQNTSVEEFYHFGQYFATDNIYWDLIDQGTKHFDLRSCWVERRLTQPELAQFAGDTITIPTMSEYNERSFCSARDMVTYRRTCLMPDVIEASQCLKTWLSQLMAKKHTTVQSRNHLIVKKYSCTSSTRPCNYKSVRYSRRDRRAIGTVIAPFLHHF